MAYLPFDINSDTTVDPAHIQANDAALDNAISGGLTETNMSSATRMPNSMLASPNVEEIITLRWGGTGGTLMVASATQPLDCIPLNVSATYTLQSASYTYFSTGAAGTAGSISINFGTIVAGAWNNVATLITGVALTNNTAANQTVTGNLTVASFTFNPGTTPGQLALICTGNSTITTPRLVVTLRVTRALQ